MVATPPSVHHQAETYLELDVDGEKEVQQDTLWQLFGEYPVMSVITHHMSICALICTFSGRKAQRQARWSRAQKGQIWCHLASDMWLMHKVFIAYIRYSKLPIGLIPIEDENILIGTKVQNHK